MKDNTYEFMIKTGKYLPDENIKSNGSILFFNKLKEQEEIYYETSRGYWYKKVFDLNKRKEHIESSNGEWIKKEFNEQGNLIYRETSNYGIVIDER